ncbi:MAG TPA: hypothetical protein PK050_07490 [Hyphomonadaceae bacterium]|nr:hypothetical protein [Hyphomonadaceae bacterium]
MGSTLRGWKAPANRSSETDDPRQHSHISLDADASDPFADETKWPLWAVALFVIAFCGAFWTGAAYLVTQLLG